MSVPVDTTWTDLMDLVSRITAVVAFVLAVAIGLGTLYVSAYLWVHGISIGEVRVDAVAMAIQSLAAAFPIYAALSMAVLIGSDSRLDRWFQTRASRGIAEGVAYLLATPWQFPILLQQPVWMWFLYLLVVGVAGLLLYFGFLSLSIRNPAERNVVAAAGFAAAGLLVLYLGAAVLHGVADELNPKSTTEIVMQTATPLPGLAASSADGTYVYRGLYVVYRDPETWFVATRTSSKQLVFAVSVDALRSITIGSPVTPPSPVPPHLTPSPKAKP